MKHIPENTDLSIYQIIRKGTYAEYGHKEYMPHYTSEKMSDQQIEHLREFLENPSLAN
ncbi:MAG: penicillin-binding protein-related factor A (putative recombinase) [Marinoscillum sp.]